MQTTEFSSTSTRLTHRVPDIVAAVSIALGAWVLLTWYLEIDYLRRMFPDHVSMKANTAVGFILAGGGLLACHHNARGDIRWTLVILLTALGLATLAQYILNVSFGIDELIVEAPRDRVLTATPGRMSPISAIGFTLFAITLIFDQWHTTATRVANRVLATLLLLIAVSSILGYAYQAPILYLGIGDLTAMALPTAIMFALLSIGSIWLRADVGFPALLNEESVAGTHIRALLPIVIAIPLLVGAAVSAGYGSLYRGEFAIALTSLGSVFATTLVAVLSIVVLRRTDRALSIRDRALDSTNNGVLITNHLAADEPIIFVNAAFSLISGYENEESLGRNCRFLNRGVDNDPEVMERLRHCIEAGTRGMFELRNRRKNGEHFWNRLSIAPISSRDGKVTHFIGIIDDVTHEREQESLLKSALHEAETANSMRDTFVRLIGHELRTPMNAALTWTRLLELNESPETRKKGLDAIAQSIDSQSRLIDDLVDVTRFKSAGVSLESESVDFRQLLETTVEELRPTISPDTKLEVRIEPEDYSAVLDPLRIKQIIRNLIGNANKYTPDGGRIDVRLALVDNQIALTIRDTGKGLTDDEIKHVFECFWRAESHQPGLGVGLYIVASLIGAYNGAIDVHSEGHDKGSTFVVRIPRHTETSDRAQLESTNT